MQGSHVTESRRLPNSVFSCRMMTARACSASLGMRWSPSLLAVFFVKRRAQLAECVAESVISGVGQVADEVQKARIEAAVAVAEVESTKGTICLQAASLSTQVEASAAKAVEVMEGCVATRARVGCTHVARH